MPKPGVQARCNRRAPLLCLRNDPPPRLTPSRVDRHRPGATARRRGAAGQRGHSIGSALPWRSAALAGVGGGVHGDPHRGALRNGPGQSLPQPPACTAPARRARHRLPGMHRARRPFPAPSMHRARGDRPSTAFPACTAGDKAEG